jgi:NO-binding membrane sensor protein with MHYT domain
MAALTDYVTLYWNTPRLVLSVTIAFFASGFSLWLAFVRQFNQHRRIYLSGFRRSRPRHYHMRNALCGDERR